MAWGKAQIDEALTAREAFEKLTLDDLRPLAGLVAADPPMRKVVRKLGYVWPLPGD